MASDSSRSARIISLPTEQTLEPCLVFECALSFTTQQLIDMVKHQAEANKDLGIPSHPIWYISLELTLLPSEEAGGLCSLCQSTIRYAIGTCLYRLLDLLPQASVLTEAAGEDDEIEAKGLVSNLDFEIIDLPISCGSSWTANEQVVAHGDCLSSYTIKASCAQDLVVKHSLENASNHKDQSNNFDTWRHGHSHDLRVDGQVVAL